MPKFTMLVSMAYHYFPNEDIIIEAADAKEAEAKVQAMSDRGEINWEDGQIDDTISIEAEEITDGENQ